MGTAAELQTAWATLVIESLVRAGITDAIISPGSRSTPFVIAALENEALECTSALDERSAAYFALGQARRTLRPSLLLCTSGSAPANYFPAVVEASEGGVPVIVLSADRPPELRGCGANQTTDQVGLYGNKVRFFADLGEPRDDAASLRALKRLVAQAVSEALGAKPGPVHLNAQARKPLEPAPASDEIRARFDAIVGEPLTQIFRARPLDPTLVEHISPLTLDAVIEAFDEAVRPVILCGPSDLRSAMFVDALDRLAERTGAVVLAQTASQFRCWAGSRALGGFDTIWQTESGRSMCLPDFVLQLGANPVSSGWEQLSAAHRIRRIVVHPWQWADPSSTAEAVVQADIGSFLAALCECEFKSARRDEDFVAGFEWAESAVWDEVSAILAQAGDALTQAGAARAVLDSVPDPSVLVLGNSLPIRDVDRWIPPSKKLLAVCSQRGVSGIDGVVSGAAGVASWVDGATTLLIGDVSFLHDLNGLQLASSLHGPIVIVVVNNGGGRIFEQLPIARDGKETWLPYFTTPHDADLECAARVYGCAFHSVDTVGGLRQALALGYAQEGCTVIEALVPPQSALQQGRDLVARVERALQAEAT
jgi:2-succinyl-5-enolpyruvyl-6-hydroxy-3-cyclohexene-1-carboxylate synthase